MKAYCLYLPDSSLRIPYPVKMELWNGEKCGRFKRMIFQQIIVIKRNESQRLHISLHFIPSSIEK